MRETSEALSDGRFGQRLGVIESRQTQLERSMKQLELQVSRFAEELAQRPLKTDVISAIAQQELAVEACASRETVDKLESVVAGLAPSSLLAALEEMVAASNTQVNSAISTISELKQVGASKASLQQQAKEIEALRARLDEKVGRDECVGLLGGKLDRTEARSIQQHQEQLQAAIAGAESQVRRLQDALSSTSSRALDATGSAKQLSSRIEQLSGQTHDVEARLTARRNELASLTKV